MANFVVNSGIGVSTLELEHWWVFWVKALLSFLAGPAMRDFLLEGIVEKPPAAFFAWLARPMHFSLAQHSCESLGKLQLG